MANSADPDQLASIFIKKKKKLYADIFFISAC